MSAGIQHLLKGGRESNRVGETRVDKIETDQFNSIIERITHGRLNPSKLAAEVTKAKVMEESPDPASLPPAAKLPGQIATWGAGPAHQLAAQRPDAHVNFLAEKVAMLERKLAQYEGVPDNEVISTTTTPAGKNYRSAEGTAMGSGIIRSSNKNTKDPVDGKIDKKKILPTQKQPEAQMAGEHVNILGISMTEWREMTGIKSPPVDLTARPQVEESYEDEVIEGVDEHQLWAGFLESYDMTPEEFSAFVEAADEAGDEEALLAVMRIEDEFQEASAATRSAMRDIGVFNKETETPKPPPIPTRAPKGGSTVAVRGALKDVKKLSSMGRQGNIGDSIEYQLWTSFLEGYESTPEEFSAFVEEADEAGDEEALVTVMELEDEFQEALAYCSEGNDAERQAKLDAFVKQHGVKKLPTRKARTLPRMRVKGGPATQFGHQLPKKAEDIEQLWGQWLGERDLSVETFDALVESAETDEDLTALEELQAMFEAQVLRGTSVAGGSPVPDVTSKLRHGGQETTMTSVVGKGLPLRSAEDRKKDLSIPRRFLPKPSAANEDDAFECDDDGNGHPDMNGKDWADAMKKLKKKHGKSGRKS